MGGAERDHVNFSDVSLISPVPRREEANIQQVGSAETRSPSAAVIAEEGPAEDPLVARGLSVTKLGVVEGLGCVNTGFLVGLCGTLTADGGGRAVGSER